MTKVAYFCCSSCGYEASDVFVEYWGKTANGEWYICPRCGEESNNTIGRDCPSKGRLDDAIDPEMARDKIQEEFRDET